MTSTRSPNDRAYIHELIDIRGTHRADYMHHMTANWSPNAQEDRHQQCFGVWAVLGSTGRWPLVCNIWEEQGLDGLASSFGDEAVGPGLQDAKLEKWWRRASEFRRGGLDRILLPAPWMPPITQQLEQGLLADVFAHEILRGRPATATDVVELARSIGTVGYDEFGWRLAGAWTTAMRDDDEVVLLWAVPGWQQWADAEKAQRSHPALVQWRHEARAHVTDWQRILLVNAPLCPFATGRQPQRADRVDWDET